MNINIKNLSMKNSVKLIICIVAISALIGCSNSISIQQKVDYYNYSGDDYQISTYVWGNDGFGSYEQVLHRQHQVCNIRDIDSIKNEQLVRAEQIKTKLLPIVKH